METGAIPPGIGDTVPGSPSSSDGRPWANPEVRAAFEAALGNALTPVSNTESVWATAEEPSEWSEMEGEPLQMQDLPIPEPYNTMISLDLAKLPHEECTMTEVYRAFGDAINEVELQKKCEVVEDPILRARRIKQLRADDELRSAVDSSFSRACGVCFDENPGVRAVFAVCGHVTCAACAETLTCARRATCPFCRAYTAVVRLVEEEEEDPVAVAVDEEARPRSLLCCFRLPKFFG